MVFAFGIYLSLVSLVFASDSFEDDAKKLSSGLKASLVKNLSEKIEKEGIVEAIEFCHTNVGLIAKQTADKRIVKFEFGRTSHKIRNPKNAPKDWMNDYLKQFEGKNKQQALKESFIHILEDKKRVYLEPLYVEAKCLLCHGENVSLDVKKEITKIYPTDKATGFKLGEFRGFIWVKEK